MASPLMEFMYNFCLLVPLVIYDNLRTLVLFFVPKRYRPIKDITGWTVVITGAGSGIGRQLAIEFSKHSCCLVLMDLNTQCLMDTEKLLMPNTRSFVYECDVTNRKQVYSVAEKVKRDAGKVDILVNNAGTVVGEYILDLPDDKIERIMHVNTLSHFWMCKAYLPDMIATNKGHIVSIASMAGLSGFPRLTDYCASKHGAVGLMESLTLELQMRKLDGVRLTTVCPTLVNTGLFEGMTPPLSVNLTPEYVAEKTVEAVREEKELLMLPPWLYIVILLKWTVPERATRAFHAKSGLLTFMDTFTGRTPKNQPKNKKSE